MVVMMMPLSRRARMDRECGGRSGRPSSPGCSRNRRPRRPAWRVGIEVGAEDPGGRCGQEILVDNGFRRVAAVVVRQPDACHLGVGGGEVLVPHRGRIGGGHRRVVALPALAASARRRAPRPRRSARAGSRRTPCRRHRGSAVVRQAPEKTSAATTHRARARRGGPWIASIIVMPRAVIRRYSSSMSSTRGVRWLMCVVVTPAMSAATAETAVSSVVPAAVDRFARQRERGHRRGDEPSARSRSRTAVGGDAARLGDERGVEQLSFARGTVRPGRAGRRRRTAASAVASIEVNTRNGLRSSSSGSIGRNAVDTTGTGDAASRRS